MGRAHRRRYLIGGYAIMAKPKVMALFAPGTNCDEETIHCFKKSGADVDRVLVQDLFDGSVAYNDYQILAIPGGFSYGDCIAAGRILANHLGTRLKDVIREFTQKDKLVIGICNGFQVLARLGLFDEPDGQVTLEQNESTKFECRWVRLLADNTAENPFLQDIEELWLPVAHAEGRLMASEETLKALIADGRVAFRYASHDGGAEVVYPENPNGSMDNIAGLTDKSKHIFGLMPHPERYMSNDLLFDHPVSHKKGGETSLTGLQIFQNAVNYFA